MSDIFREVDEAVREDRAKTIWKRYGAIAVLAAVLVISAAGGWVFWQNYTADRDRARTADLIMAVEASAEDPEAGLAAIQSYLGSAGGGHVTLARLHEAALLAESGRREDAVAAYRLIAEQTDQPWADAAALFAVLHDLDHGDPEALHRELTRLAAGASPWRFTARELTALLYSREGRIGDAISEWEVLAEDVDAPPGIRSRASELLALHAERADGAGS
jgi:hypothetical protein